MPTLGGPKAPGRSYLDLNCPFGLSIMEFRNNKVVHGTQCLSDPFETPALRGERVQQNA